MKKETRTLYVHGSKFHSDDLLCAAMGKILGYNIVRTLDKEIVNKIGPHDLVCDFGRLYDGVRFFDHHQHGSPTAQEVGIHTRFPYSKTAAAGQLWAKYGADVVRAIDPRVPEASIQEVVDNVDYALIGPSDRFDNGESVKDVTTFSQAVGWFNPDNQDLEEFDKAFFNCLDNIVLPTLKRCVTKMLMKIYSREFIKSAPIIENTVIVLDKYAAWQGTVLRTDRFNGCLYVVFPSLRGGWNGQVIPISPFVNDPRKPFPIQWAGLDDKQFCEAAGIPYSGGNYFCHEGRFLMGAPTKEECVKLCLKAACA